MAHIYLVGFDDGLIKAGMTRKPERRFSGYFSQVGPFAVEVSATWLSDVLDDAADLEVALLKAMATVSRCTFGREWFRGVAFADAVELAQVIGGGGTTKSYSGIDSINDPIEVIYLPTGQRARILDPAGDGIYIEVLDGQQSYPATAFPEQIAFAPRNLHIRNEKTRLKIAAERERAWQLTREMFDGPRSIAVVKPEFDESIATISKLLAELSRGERWVVPDQDAGMGSARRAPR